MLLRHHLVQVNSHPRPLQPTAALMASSPPPAFVTTLLLLLAGTAAAQQLSSTNASDAAALLEVFQRWGLADEAAVLASADDPCQKRVWYESFWRNASVGCSCSSGECRVTHLNVTGYWNITEIPLALFNLTELVSLDLSNNNLTGSIPQEVANLSKLETWHFNNNYLRGSFPPGSLLLRNLQSLWMFDNYIDGPVPEFIQNFSNLKDLRLYGMKLQGPIPTNFSKLTNLEHLMLGDLDGNHSSFDFIADRANLSTLSLSKCGLSGQIPSARPNLPKLNYLNLRSNNLSGPIVGLLPYKNSDYIYVGENNFNGHLPSEIVEASLALDVTNNPLLSGTLLNNPAGTKWPINYIGTSIDARTSDSENLAILNCHLRKECNKNNLSNSATSLAINCGGKQMKISDSSPTVFSEDSTDLGGAGFHVNNASHWVVSHVGSDPFSKSPGIVNTSQDILGTNIPQLYQTARTSTSALWYYVVGLTNRNYTVQLFFAEIVIVDGPGRRLFNIDIQGQNIKKDFNIVEEAGGVRRHTNVTHEVIVDNSILTIHLYWSGRGTCCIPYRGAYGPLVSAIKVFPSQDMITTPPQAPPRASHSARQEEKRKGVVAGIAALCIAAAVISSSVVYLWQKWVSLVKHPTA